MSYAASEKLLCTLAREWSEKTNRILAPRNILLMKHESGAEFRSGTGAGAGEQALVMVAEKDVCGGAAQELFLAGRLSCPFKDPSTSTCEVVDSLASARAFEGFMAGTTQ